MLGVLSIEMMKTGIYLYNTSNLVKIMPYIFSFIKLVSQLSGSNVEYVKRAAGRYVPVSRPQAGNPTLPIRPPPYIPWTSAEIPTSSAPVRTTTIECVASSPSPPPPPQRYRIPKLVREESPEPDVSELLKGPRFGSQYSNGKPLRKEKPVLDPRQILSRHYKNLKKREERKIEEITDKILRSKARRDIGSLKALKKRCKYVVKKLKECPTDVDLLITQNFVIEKYYEAKDLIPVFIKFEGQRNVTHEEYRILAKKIPNDKIPGLELPHKNFIDYIERLENHYITLRNVWY